MALVQQVLRSDDQPLTHAPAKLTRMQYAVKRGFDFGLAGLLLTLLSPVLLVIAVAVKLSSPGPVLYRQQRMMRHGRVFTMLKFRTMVHGADGLLDDVFHLNQAKGPLFKSRADPRVTRVGRLLRGTFLDELPQLVNILMGHMSFVGPRPCLVREADLMPDQAAVRLSVPQGLTGPWQVNGHHALTFEEQMEVELEYIKGWWIGRDLGILARTVPLVLSRTGF